jgi:hypothetical protein
MSEAFAYPLKWKYRNPLAKGQFKCGSYKGRTGNSHGPKKHSVLYFLNATARARGRK